ncbi:MAG: HEPN domain-containing protein [Elusimicrobia bacterium]|nr:HEPN domain-containing protein [Elusimicrobiota bacterium]
MKQFIDLIRYRIEKSKSTLADAQKYLKDVSLDSTVNRIYYAMFYAVNSLLISKGLFSSKHSGVIAIFNREFIKPGIINQDLGKFYSDMLDHRQESDYKDFVRFDKNEVEQWLHTAEEFIKRIENIVNNVVNEK